MATSDNTFSNSSIPRFPNSPPRLGVNIDHVATLRNARGGAHPCPVRAALAAMEAGADGITAHLREDRRHISDADLFRLRNEVNLPLNMEMAATDEMLEIALRLRPHACCIVPEKRAELTTEGGLNVKIQEKTLKPFIAELRGADIRVSLFIDPDAEQIAASRRCGADIVELHTGQYAEIQKCRNAEKINLCTSALLDSASLAHGLGLEVHAGHGLNFDNVGAIAAIPEMAELNIGHFLIGEALFSGLQESIRTMHRIMNEARQ